MCQMNVFLSTLHRGACDEGQNATKFFSILQWPCLWLPMCGFIGKLVDHCTSIEKVTGSNPDAVSGCFCAITIGGLAVIIVRNVSLLEKTLICSLQRNKFGNVLQSGKGAQSSLTMNWKCMLHLKWKSCFQDMKEKYTLRHSSSVKRLNTQIVWKWMCWSDWSVKAHFYLTKKAVSNIASGQK